LTREEALEEALRRLLKRVPLSEEELTRHDFDDARDLRIALDDQRIVRDCWAAIALPKEDGPTSLVHTSFMNERVRLVAEMVRELIAHKWDNRNTASDWIAKAIRAIDLAEVIK
jgi:hypothetical protein